MQQCLQFARWIALLPTRRLGQNRHRTRLGLADHLEQLAVLLRTTTADFMGVNQILGSPGFGFYSPLAMASMRAVIGSRGIAASRHRANHDGLHGSGSEVTRSKSTKKSSSSRRAVAMV